MWPEARKGVQTLGSSTSARSSWEDWADELPRHTMPAFSACVRPHTSEVCVWSGATKAAEKETRESMVVICSRGGGLGVRGASRAHGVHVLVALLSWREGGSRRRAQGDSRCRFVKRCPLPYTPSSPISLKCCNQPLEARIISSI